MIFVGAIPVALIEEDVYGNVGNHVNVTSGYDNHRRRRRDPIHGRRTYADIHADLRTAFRKYPHGEQKKNSE